MPGTIQVSVLGFAVSQSPTSQISIKVSMGKREYKTLDKGEFSFPLTSLRENLIVVLQDEEGNEVSRTGVETGLLIEKGVWDDMFPLDGGGHVHLKLQFVLSEEDREKIRATRQSALKKKHEELLNSEVRSPRDASILATNAATVIQPINEVSGSSSRDLKESLQNVAHLFKKGKRAPDSLQKQDDADAKEETTSATAVNSADVGNKTRVKEKRLEADDPEMQSPLEKTASNVRNMVNVFESRLNQDTRPQDRPLPPPITSQSRVGFVGAVAGSRMTNVQKERTEKESKSKIEVKHKEDNIEADEMPSEQSGRTSTARRASVSGRVPDVQPSGRPFSNFFSSRRHSGSSLLIRRSGGGTHAKVSKETRVEQASEDENNSLEPFGAWIFPGEGTHLCITTASKVIMNRMGGSWGDEKMGTSAEENARKCNFAQGGAPTKPKEAESEKTSPRQRIRRVEDPNNEETSTGPLGQAMKVAIMIGFATLVFLTRKRNPDR